jgi:hypothetical protein
VGTQFPAIAVNGCYMVGTLDFDVLLATSGGVGQLNFVGSKTTPVVGTAVLAVKGIPGVGQSYGSECFTVLGKQCLSQKGYIAHEEYSPFRFGAIRLQFNT